MSNKEQTPARKRSNANLKPVRKGDKARNPKGRPPGKSIRQLLREHNEKDKKAVIAKMYGLAKKGDVRAAEWIAKHGDPAALEVVTQDFTIILKHPSDIDDD